MGTPYIYETTSWSKLTYFCKTCGAEISAGTPCFEVKGAAKRKNGDYCSMACARKALGVVPEVWSFGVNLSTRNTRSGYIRGLHATMPNGKQRVVLVHDAGFDIDGNDIALLQAAPQAAANLQKAEAEAAMYRNLAATLQEEGNMLEARAQKAEADNVRLERDYDFLTAENAKLRAELDATEDKAQAMFEALRRCRENVRNAWLITTGQTSNTLRKTIDIIDAALGQDDEGGAA